MPILNGDIKLLASAVMDDVPEGGGAPTANVIADGVSNAIFPDISELDRAGGRVNLRKLHVSVQTADRDTYLGSNIIVAEPPADPNVSVTIFTTRSTFDTRLEASSTVESYLIRGPMWGGFLYENHVVGQRVIQIFQRPELAEPTIGRTLVLVSNEDTPGELIQYVRVIRSSSAVMEFIDDEGKKYKARVCVCEISDALRYAFKGTPANPRFLLSIGKTAIRDTSVADAGAYCGVSGLRKAAALGDSKVLSNSIYTQLVPSAATEKIDIDIKPSNTSIITLAVTPRRVEVGVSPHNMRVRIGQENRAFSYVQILSPLPEPGTVEIAYLALGSWYVLRDDGLGGLTGQGTGVVNYANGNVSVTLTEMPDASSSLLYVWGERVGYSNYAGLASYRAPEFTFDLAHKGVDLGSLTVTWLSGGVVKTAVAGANGQLTGHATGFLSHTEGLLTIRPTAMIDADGEFSLDYTWSPTVMETKTGLSVGGGGLVTFTTDSVPVEGSVMVEWFTTRSVGETSGSTLAEGSSTKSTTVGTVTDAAQRSASKTIHWPPSITSYTNYSGGGGGAGTGAVAGIAYLPAVTWSPARDKVVVSTRGVSSTTTSDSAVGSSSKLSVASSQVSNTVIALVHSITENGAGGFLNSLGTINYAGKTITLKVVDPSTTAISYKNDTESASDFATATSTSSADPGSVSGTYAVYAPASSSSSNGTQGGSQATQGGSFGTTSVAEVFDNTALFVTYRTGSAVATPHTESYKPAVVSIDLAPLTSSRIVPGSVQFTWMGHVFNDIEGSLYRDASGASPGTPAGVIDYARGLAYVTDYVVSGSPTDFTLGSLWVSKGSWTTSKVSCRTPTAPVKPGGFVMSIVSVDGSQIIATGDNSGAVTGSHCLGTIDYQTGTVDLIFGDLVTETALTDAQRAEWWYAEALEQITAAGKVWRPWPIDPNSLRFNAVSYFYLPLDAELLGIDPVRLPSDGRVPIFRAGGFAVVGHTGRITATVSNAQVIDCARVRLSRVHVVGNDGTVITTGYTADLDAGTVTFTSVTGYSQPVTIEHRIEDMGVVREVQINGEVAFTRPLTHDYPLGSFVSSALVAGDLKSRVSTFFDQTTWGNVWSGAVIGANATGTYNNVASPLVVTNAGAISERWALVFTNSTAFNVIGEHVGVIATGSTGTATSPINPVTSEPYFTVPALGWGTGWAAGNVLRFDTVGAMAPVWVARTVQQGPNTGTKHSFTLLSRGDVDRP